MGLVIQQEGDIVYGAAEGGGGGGGGGSTMSTSSTSGRSKPLVTQLSFDTRDLHVRL